jgi:predicted transposase YbfD/YdcC
VAADHGNELEAALEVLGLIALKGKVVTADALHCNRRTVAAIVRRRMIWNIRADLVADGLGSSGLCYAA